MPRNVTHPAPRVDPRGCAFPARQARLARGLAGLLALVAVACERESAVPVTQVLTEPFEIHIRAFGELKAARTTQIEIPPTLQGIQRIAWIAPDGVMVGEGDLVARLDADQIERRLAPRRNQLRKLQFQLDAKKQELAKELKSIEGELAVLAQELEDALAVDLRDETLFSKHEIIDAEINLDLIETKIAHFESQLERTKEREKAELEILRLERETEEVRIAQLEQARKQLEIHAPHAGFFLVGHTWQGEKMRVGMELWSGQTLGELPDLDRMEAKIFVLESEAAGLAAGLPARLTLDAHPGQSISGTVKTIQPIANPIEEESPVKYFEVVLALDRTDTQIMKPAGQVHATVEVTQKSSALSVPNQAIFVEDGQPWVYLLQSGKFERRSVELGQRSVSRTVITAGLAEGDRIALVDPHAEDQG